MPRTFEPFRNSATPRGHTFFRVFTGPGTPFDGLRGKMLADIKAPSLTFLIVEAGESVPWTRPDELPYRTGEELPKLGGILRDGRFRVALVDGSVWHFEIADEDAIRAAVTGAPWSKSREHDPQGPAGGHHREPRR
jgi:hypothetical protein